MALLPGRPIVVVPALALALVAAAPSGASYTKAQAAAGARTYAASCARCHGARLDGGMGPPLKGALAPYHGTETVGDVYRFVSTQMPLDRPGGLDSAAYAAIVAFLMMENGHPAGSRALTPSAARRSLLKM